MSIALAVLLIAGVLAVIAGQMMDWDEKRRDFWGLVVLCMVAIGSCCFFALLFGSGLASLPE